MRFALLVVGCLVALALAPVALAEWVESGSLNAGGGTCCDEGSSYLAVNSSGAIVGAVRDGDGLHAIVRDAGGSVTAPDEPVLPGSNAGSFGAVGIDAAGTAVVIGQASDGSIITSTRPPGGAFTSPDTLGDGADVRLVNNGARLADVNRSGQAITYVSEVTGDGGGWLWVRPQVRVRSAGGTWAGAEEIPFPQADMVSTALIGLRMGSDGAAYAFAVTTTMAPDVEDWRNDIVVYRRAPGGGWSGPIALAAPMSSTDSGGSLKETSLVSSRAGTKVAVAWATAADGTVDTTGANMIDGATATAEPAPAGTSTSLAADAHGNVWAVVYDDTQGDQLLYHLDTSAGSPAWSPVALANPPYAVASDDGGDRVVSLRFTSSVLYAPAGPAWPAADGFAFSAPWTGAGSVGFGLDVAASGVAAYIGTDGSFVVHHLARWGSQGPPPPPPPPPPECTITGTDAAETLRGTDGPDVICGLGGNDILLGLAGDDSLRGGDGNDRLYGDEGRDTILGGDGHDTINAGTGDDSVDGGPGDDRMDGKAGTDVVRGGDGGDVVIGGYDGDQLYGDAGVDLLQDGVGVNQFDGGAGNDWIYSRQSRKENVNCGAGTDHFQADTKRPDRVTGCERRLPTFSPPHALHAAPAAFAAGSSAVVTWTGRVPSFWPHRGNTMTWAGITSRGCPDPADPRDSGAASAGLWASVRDRNVARKKYVRFEWKVQAWAQRGFSLNAAEGWRDTSSRDDNVTRTSGRAPRFHPHWAWTQVLPLHDSNQSYRLLVRITWYHELRFRSDEIARTDWIELVHCDSGD